MAAKPIVSRGVVQELCALRGIRRFGPGRSDGHGWQLDRNIVAHRRDGFEGHVAGSLDGPLVVLFQQDGADEAGDGVVVGD